MTTVDLPDLRDWLPRQRWFSGKGRPITGTAVTDTIPLPGDPPAWLAAVQVDHADGLSDRWLLVLTPARDQTPIGTVDGVPVSEIGDVPQAALTLLAFLGEQVRVPTGSGAEAHARVLGPPPPTTGTVKPMGVEQSNTSLVVHGDDPGDRVVVKVVRHLEVGPNPDLEITEALTRERFTGTPALRGYATGPEQEALVVVTDLVDGARGGWELAVDEAGGRADHGVLARMEDLGATTARMHAAMAAALPTRQATPADDDRWRAGVLADADRTRQVLTAVSPVAARRLTQVVEEMLDAAPADHGLLQRTHGDYHLGQVLLDQDGTWWILDFEGEPARPIAERREPANPAKDVAGMLRSFDYARAQAVRSGAPDADAARWAERARAAFLAGYEREAGEDRTSAWVRPLETEKLLYEVRYEAANRPSWLPIPLGALGLDASVTSPPQTTEAPRDTRADDTERTVAATTASPTPPSQPTSDPAPPAPASRTGTAAPTAPAASTAPAMPAGRPPADIDADIAELLEGRLHDPHRLLGYHADGDGWAVRAFRPGAESVAYLADPDADPVPCTQRAPGLFEATVAEQPRTGRYRLRVAYPEGGTYDLVDPYSFPPILGEVDQHLLAEGRHEQAWTVMGANRRTIEEIGGVGFAVWAPNARAVRVVGDFNRWDGRLHQMRTLGSSGIWELFVPDVEDGAHYKFEMVTADGSLVTRADPWAKYSDVPPGTASRVFTSSFQPQHADGARQDPHSGPVSIYEVHMASWRHDDGRPLTYAELGEQLGDYLVEMGFTHVELLPPAEHPFGGSWGYQVTGQFAPTSRFGDPDDFRRMVDHLHSRGIGVIVDWVPAHFPKDEWALRLFDGTALYEHEDPRLGEHPDWGTMVFNYGRTEVRNFIVASALFWLESIGVDALRVDAVASMLYLDYSRQEGQWIPNEHGGRENLRAVELLQEVNATVYKRNPGAFTVAEESTAWPGVSRPTHLGGLGFGFKWNMGWMHDTLSYFSKDPIYRRWHHNQLTFGLMYAFSENFVLPLSHDEVVHGKGSLLGKMPGDRWRQFANLRSLFGWMWGHPGKQLLFMGGEFGQEREWSEERSLDWHLLEDPAHEGVRRCVADLNRVYRENPALWRRDSEGEAFSWIDANNADDNTLSFFRRGGEGDPTVAVIANLSPSPRHEVRFGLPHTGQWTEILNTDAQGYGGGNVGNYGGVTATDKPWHGQPASAEVTCPPLGVIWLRHDG